MREMMMKSELNLKVDFRNITGTMKPMHGIGQPPVTGLSNFFFPYLKRAGIPYSRLHDVGGMMGGNLYVDIPNIFRDFSAEFAFFCNLWYNIGNPNGIPYRKSIL